MKKINKHKKSLLAAAILCSITGSAFALPTGGVVTSGNVTNVTDPSKVMTAGAHSIIDWKTFDIAKNEKVTFDTKSFMVLNNVNGGQESKILGMLVDQGKGRLLLVNPSGIVLGKDAVINANNITLSTLRISNDQFQKLINGETATFENNDLSKGVTIEKNAKMTLKEALNLYGGKITIADGVEIISKDYGTAAVDIIADKQLSTNISGGLTSSAGGTITVGSVNIGTDKSPVSHLDLRGNNVSLNGVNSVSDNKTSKGNSFTMLSGTDNLDISDSSFKNLNGEMFLVTSSQWKSNQNVSFFELGANLGNNINIDNSNFVTAKDDMTILGGNVNITKSNIDSGNNLIVGAVKSYGNEAGVRSATTYDTSTVTIDEPTTVRAKGSSIVYGAILNVNPNKFKHTIPSDSPLIEILDRNDLTIDEIIELVQKHNPDISADEIRSAFNSMYVVPKPVVDSVIPGTVINSNDSDALKSLLDSLKLKEQQKNQIEKTDDKQDIRNITELNELFKKNEEKIQGGLNSIIKERKKIKNDRRNKARIAFAEKDYAGKIPENEDFVHLIDGQSYNGMYKLEGNMYIKDIKTDVITKDNNIKVKFDVYNCESISGAVEVYDADGNKIKTEWIDPFKRHAENVKETFEDISKSFTFSIPKGITLSDELVSEKTSVEITVPAGGYFRIINNENQSPSLKLHNLVSNAIESTGAIINMITITDGFSKDKVIDAFVDVATEVAIQDGLIGLTMDAGEDYINAGINRVLDSFMNGENSTVLVDKLKERMSAKGIAESTIYTVIDIVSAPTKPVQDILFAGNMAFNAIEREASRQRTHAAKATNFLVAY